MLLREYVDWIKRFLTPGDGLAEQAVTGGMWMMLLNISDRALQLTKLVILARLLSPSDFGLMGISLLILASIEQFSEIGVEPALIQQKDKNIDCYLNTAWVMKIARGILVATVAFLLAPYAAELFNEPRATDIIRVIVIIPVIGGFQNPGIVYLQKDLEFHKEFAYTISTTLINVISSTVAAIVLQNVWALVIGSLLGSVAAFILSYVIHNYRPSIEIDTTTAAEMLHYGKWITLSGILTFLYEQGDDAFVGWLLGASTLGLYQMAYRFSNAPATEITGTISQVLFPVYSRIQDDKEMLSKTYFTALKLILVVTVPMSVGIIVVARPFIDVFLGDEWLSAVTVLQILTVWGFVRAISSASGPIFKAVGVPDYITKIQIVNVLLLGVLIFPLTISLGARGTGIAVVAATTIGGTLGVHFSLDFVDIRWKDLIEIVLYPSLASFLMGAGVYITNDLLLATNTVFEFSLLVTTGIATYLVLIAVSEYLLGYNLASDIKFLYTEATQ